MDLANAIRGRRSIRDFRAGEPCPPEAIEALKEAIVWAPSAGNIQARHFYFVADPEIRTALGACSFQAGIFENAALVVVGCTESTGITKEYGERGRHLYAPQDVAAATQNLLLTAHALGLGAVWIGALEPRKVQAVLGHGPTLEAVVMVPIGWPAETPAPPEHLPASRLFTDL